ncbi:MAG: MATE family efflux transporter [Clostridia bacterium]|nr:MATE family efflux transporter [Clostridia bacterium]
MAEVKELKENKMGTMKIPSLLFSISVPIIISMVVQALYNIVDSIFVAKLDPIAGTGALTLAFPIQNLMIALAVGLAVGMNALLSRSLGEKDSDRANLIAGQGFFLTLCGYLVFLIFGLFLTEPFVALQKEVGSDVYNFSVDYISITSIGSIGVFIQVVTERLMQATGRSLYSMLIQLSGAVVNIILDPILIFGLCGAPAMGVAGAAIATVIGQLVAAAVGIFLNLKFNPEITLKLKNLIPVARELRDMLAIGIPSVLMQAIGSVMTFSMNNILGGFSQEAENVFGVYFKLQSFVFMPVFGLNNGMVPIIAYNFGARKKSRIYATMKLAAVVAVSYMILGLLVFQLFPELLLSFFSAGEGMIAIGNVALRTISLSFVLAGFSIVSISTCQALGKSIYSLIVSIARQLVVLIPAAYLFSLSGNVNLVWWSFPIAELVGCTLCIIFVTHVLRKALGNMNEEKLDTPISIE